MTTPVPNILIVDDLAEKLLALRSLLEDLGANLVEARSGAQALKEVLKREFAAILLDVNMPDIDGFETASLIRRYRKSVHTPIIFITSYVDEIQAARGYSLGAVDYIVSPVVPDVLRTKVKVFVDLHRLREQIRTQAEERVALAHAEAARAAAEAASERAQFLADASRALGSSLDAASVAEGVTHLLVPRLGELCAVRLGQGKGDAAQMRLLWQGLSGLRRDLRMGRAGLPEPVLRAIDLALSQGAGQCLDDPGVWDEGDGAARPLASALVVPLSVHGEHLGVLVVADSRKRYVAQDLLLLEELADRAAVALVNARLYRDLQAEIVERKQVEAALREAHRRKDEFLAMLSHELRNPLAPIRNAVELMRRMEPSQPQLEWARDLIERQVGHLARMVDELLDVSRIRRGKITLKKETLDLAAILAHTIETTRPLIESRRHVLAVEGPPRPVWIKGDFVRLVQVFSNLLNNAAKYTEEGGRIELAASAQAGTATVAVKDSGIGIPPELLPTVFDLFTQADRALDRSQGGLGIGLTVVRQLVELHGGEVEARSAGAGKGAELIVRLPCLMAVEPESSPGRRGDPLPAPRGIRVLVVDDNLDAAVSIAMLLRLEGHEVEHVGDGLLALERAKALRPEVVLLDIGLPGMDGYELVRSLRGLDPLQHSLFVALTGYGQEKDRARAVAMGFDHHLVKPAAPHVIQELIARWHAGRRGGRPGRDDGALSAP